MMIGCLYQTTAMPIFEQSSTEDPEIDAVASDAVSEDVRIGSLGQQEKIKKFFEKTGFLSGSHRQQDRSDTADTNLTDAIVNFQRFFRIPVTGTLDPTVLELIDTPRCGVPDVGSFSVSWSRWYDTNLTYHVEDFDDVNSTIDHQTVRWLIAEAMQIWMEVTPLILCEKRDPEAEADIVIKHVRGEHGDGIAFDGLGGTLAHAFLPSSGQIHFDAEESWTLSVYEDFNYLQVALHEIGHALGLLHSGVEGAIMYPFYQHRPVLELTADDIAGIQTIYGSPDMLPERVRYERCPAIVDTDWDSSGAAPETPFPWWTTESTTTLEATSTTTTIDEGTTLDGRITTGGTVTTEDDPSITYTGESVSSLNTQPSTVTVEMETTHVEMTQVMYDTTFSSMPSHPLSTTPSSSASPSPSYSSSSLPSTSSSLLSTSQSTTPSTSESTSSLPSTSQSKTSTSESSTTSQSLSSSSPSSNPTISSVPSHTAEVDDSLTEMSGESEERSSSGSSRVVSISSAGFHIVIFLIYLLLS